MAQHWEKILRYEKDPQDKKATYGTKSLQEMLLAEKFDFVTIQQYSLTSHDVATYRPYARNLYDFIKKRAPQAEVFLHQTWAYRCDDPRFTKKSTKPGQPATQEAMYQGLTQAYETIAAELGVRIVPVGDAFHLADTDPAWGYKPRGRWNGASDVSRLAGPTPLAARRLALGQRQARQTRASDGWASCRRAGQYLGACVFYEMLFGETVVGNKFVPKGLDEAYARYLQQTAHEAAERRRVKRAVCATDD